MTLPSPVPRRAPRPGPSDPSSLRETHPTPQRLRPEWANLDGWWEFAFDDEDRGVGEAWFHPRQVFPQTILVPYPPESRASGVGDPGPHPVVWYRRTVVRDQLTEAGLGTQGERLLLHFGAVDYRAEVWLDGQYLGDHEGGQTPFSFDITDVVSGGGSSWVLVVRAVDDPVDVSQPRGKQDWQLEPHGIWYHRTTGIWQPVWLEAVSAVHIVDLAWDADLAQGSVRLRLELSHRPGRDTSIEVVLGPVRDPLSRLQVDVTERLVELTIPVARQRNGQGYEAMLWRPERPRLIDATVTVDGPGGRDEFYSYLGLRSVGWAGGHFMLNDRPYFLRAVLEQGYWPETHLAAPDGAALRSEVQLAKDLGFNTVRVHEKAEDPRYLYWADRLGLLVWGESASAYEFSATAVERTVREWTAIVRRDRSHPSVVTWVPLNESWGVQHIAHDPAQLHYAQSLYHLTKALDPSRPVISNDGWEHAVSDIWTIHDYRLTGTEMSANYASTAAVDQLMAGIGPLGRRMLLIPGPRGDKPVVVSEFGGISFAPVHDGQPWGYLVADSEADFERLLTEQFEALQSSPVLAGFCYTQLTDTLQEANGLTDPARKPKLPIETIRRIVLGLGVDTSSHLRPARPIEQPATSPLSVEQERARDHGHRRDQHLVADRTAHDPEPRSATRRQSGNAREDRPDPALTPGADIRKANGELGLA